MIRLLIMKIYNLCYKKDATTLENLMLVHKFGIQLDIFLYLSLFFSNSFFKFRFYKKFVIFYLSWERSYQSYHSSYPNGCWLFECGARTQVLSYGVLVIHKQNKNKKKNLQPRLDLVFSQSVCSIFYFTVIPGQRAVSERHWPTLPEVVLGSCLKNNLPSLP